MIKVIGTLWTILLMAAISLIVVSRAGAGEHHRSWVQQQIMPCRPPPPPCRPVYQPVVCQRDWGYEHRKLQEQFRWAEQRRIWTEAQRCQAPLVPYVTPGPSAQEVMTIVPGPAVSVTKVTRTITYLNAAGQVVTETVTTETTR